ncbi:MAG: DUF4381 domain-containing protein [Halioglobus sp.]
MNPQDPLANLHPLRDPALVDWWPLAPGWWALIALLLLGLAALALLFYRRYQANAYRRQASDQALALHQHWLSDSQSTEYLGAVNGLLKSVALRAFPEQELAAKTGEGWINFLNQTLPNKAATEGFSVELASAAYQPGQVDIDCESVHNTALLWIRKHRVAKQ